MGIRSYGKVTEGRNPNDKSSSVQYVNTDAFVNCKRYMPPQTLGEQLSMANPISGREIRGAIKRLFRRTGK